MRISMAVLIAAASIWTVIELGLILRDRANAKGTTRSDQMTRWFNLIAIEIALFAPLSSFLMPGLLFGKTENLAMVLIGTGMICLGLGLRYWAISVLGRYFRTTVEIEAGQKVVQSGPYRLIRHPSYSGIILFCAGYGLVSQNWLALLSALLLPAAALVYRIGVEERAFVNEIGAEYVQYQARTKKLIPFVW
jgi:protein-S-isoprenylcysteine O-methyltransferase Ste14